MPEKGERILGNHCVILNGWRDNRPYTYRNGKAVIGFWNFINFYGSEWGDEGRGYLPYEFVKNYAIEIITSSTYKELQVGFNHMARYKNEEIYLKMGRNVTGMNGWLVGTQKLIVEFKE